MSEADAGDSAIERPLRAKRTYGRRKDSDASNAPTSNNLSIYTAGSALHDTLESTLASEIRVELLGNRRIRDLAGDTFGLRKELANIDEEFNREEGDRDTSHGESTRSTTRPAASHNTEISNADAERPENLRAKLNLYATPSTPPGRSRYASAEAGSHGSNGHHRVLSESVALPDRFVDDQEQSPQSPPFPHPINTPKTRSSPTPPTSDADEGNTASPTKKASTPLPLEEANTSRASRPAKLVKNKKTKTGGSEKQLKKLNKKEEKEAKLEHVRLLAGQEVAIEKRFEPLKLSAFFDKIQTKPLAGPSHTASSDPIQDFTSSQNENAKEDEGLKPVLERYQYSDEEMPDTGTILKQHQEKKADEEARAQRRERLRRLKQRALEASKATSGAAPSDSEDDELELVNNEGKQPTRNAQVTKYTKTVMALAHVPASRRVSMPASLHRYEDEKEMLRAAARPSFGATSRRSLATMDHRVLKEVLLHQTDKQSRELTKEKEEEWLRRGGKLKGRTTFDPTTEDGPPVLDVSTLTRKILERRAEEEDKQETEASEHDDANDDDYVPFLRCSASPVTGEGEEVGSESDGRDEFEPQDEDDDDAGMPNEMIKSGHRARRAVRAVRAVLDESDEDDSRSSNKDGCVLVPDTSIVIDFEDAHVRAQGLAHRGSLSSFEETTPDEDDKENDTRLMFNRSEDKENVAVPIHVPVGRSSQRPSLASRQGSGGIFELTEGVRRRLSMSPSADINADHERGSKPLQAKPVGDLDDPFAFPSPSTSRVIKLQALPVAVCSPTRSNSPKPLQQALGGSGAGLSQYFDDDDGVPFDEENAPPRGVLRPAFGAPGNVLRRSQSVLEPSPMKTGGMTPLFSPEPPRLHDRLKRPGQLEELSLTLDSNLQPALDVTSQVKRRADAIFEKEQDFVLEEANQKQQKKPELYVNENGLLTQTKPEVSTPIVYRSWSPKSAAPPTTQPSQVPPSAQRLPLSTLSFTSESSSPSHRTKLPRLRKRRSTSPSSESEASGGPQASNSHGRPQDAFQFILNAAEQERKRKEQQKLAKSEFIEGEAVESDDDEMLGFGPRVKQDDEESDDDDPDAVIENLVDDATMDMETLAENKVLEKHKEHQEQDDAELHKLHQAVVEGKYRSKRRSGVNLDDSDDDDEEDEEARRLRRKMYKKRRVEGDTLEALAKNEKSRAFYEAYQRDVEEDDNEDFHHLDMDELDKASDEEGDAEPRETITTSELTAKLREAAQSERREAFDPDNVDWADKTMSSEPDIVEVKDVELQPWKSARSGRRLQQSGVEDLERPSRVGKWNEEQLTAWRKEQSSRNVGVAPARGSTSVTGHAKSSRVGKPMGQSQADKRESRKITKAPSMLASVTDKHSRFG